MCCVVLAFVIVFLCIRSMSNVQLCQCLWIFHSWLSLRFSLTFIFCTSIWWFNSSSILYKTNEWNIASTCCLYCTISALSQNDIKPATFYRMPLSSQLCNYVSGHVYLCTIFRLDFGTVLMFWHYCFSLYAFIESTNNRQESTFLICVLHFLFWIKRKHLKQILSIKTLSPIYGWIRE